MNAWRGPVMAQQDSLANVVKPYPTVFTMKFAEHRSHGDLTNPLNRPIPPHVCPNYVAPNATPSSFATMLRRSCEPNRSGKTTIEPPPPAARWVTARGSGRHSSDVA